MYASLFGGVMVRGEHTAVFSWSYDDRCYHGKIVSIPDLVLFEADHPFKLELAFKDALVDYLVLCRNKKKAVNVLPVDLSQINLLT